MSEGAGSSRATRVARGAAWIMGGRLAVRALGLVSTLILARLLAPDDFGLVAIGVTAMQLLQNISDIGVSRAVIKFRDAGREHFDTLFTLSLIRGVLISVFLALAAPAAAALYGDPRVGAVLLALSAAPLAYALMNPRFFELERELAFAPAIAIAAVEKLVAVVVAVGLALAFQSFWAIVIGLVAGAFVHSALSWTVRPYRPRLSVAAWGALRGFAGWLTGLSFVAALNNKLDILLLGKFAPASDVGAFYVGGSIASLPSGEIAMPMARALYPGFSELQGDAEAMRAAYLRGVEALAFIATPAALGMAFVADDLVALLLGPGWERAALMLKYFAPAAGLAITLYATNAYAMALGAARALFLRECLLFSIRMPMFLIGAVWFGLEGAVAACAAALVLAAGLNAGLYARLSARPALEPFWRARRAFVGAALMSAYFIWVRPAFGPLEDWSTAARLGADIAVGAALHFSVVFALWRRAGAPDGPERLALAAAKAARLRAFDAMATVR